jgi:hypothetical protein
MLVGDSMPTYIINNPITTPKGVDFEVGDTATDKDIPSRDVKWLLEQGIIEVAGKKKASPASKVVEVITEEKEEEDE